MSLFGFQGGVRYGKFVHLNSDWEGFVCLPSSAPPGVSSTTLAAVCPGSTGASLPASAGAGAPTALCGLSQCPLKHLTGRLETKLLLDQDPVPNMLDLALSSGNSTWPISCPRSLRHPGPSTSDPPGPCLASGCVSLHVLLHHYFRAKQQNPVDRMVQHCLTASWLDDHAQPWGSYTGVFSSWEDIGGVGQWWDHADTCHGKGVHHHSGHQRRRAKFSWW